MVNHWMQAQLYLWMVNQKVVTMETNVPLDLILKDVAIITYLAKGHKYIPCKVFEVERDKKFTKMMSEIVRNLREYRNHGIIPTRVCSSLLNPMAKDCVAKSFCFKEDD